MPIMQVNENKDGFDNLAGSATTGIPMGTWASFEGDYAPNIEWLRAGTTFNANTYPALAMYLGGTTVPERFDHNRLGDVEQITPAASSFTAQYDGILIVTGYSDTTMNVQINGVAWSNMYATNVPKNVQVPFNKGDVITFGSSRAPNVRYYKHPLFIKATPTSSDSDYEGTLNAIRQYVANAIEWKLLVENQTGGTFTIPDSATEVLINISNSSGSVVGTFNSIIASLIQRSNCSIPCNNDDRSMWNITNNGKTFTYSGGDYNIITVYYRDGVTLNSLP